jgi:hypothetical protein
MTNQNDIWNCSECGQLQGRHDMWFDGVCENCNTNATKKGTFYINELACELADLFIKQTYEYTTETIWEDDGDGGSKYTEFMQEQFDIIHDRIESLLLRNQLKK